MTTLENTIDLSQCAAGFADAAALMAEAAEHLSEAARTMYHAFQPEANIFPDNKNKGECGEGHALSSHRSDAEDVNVYRPESRVETPASPFSMSERAPLHPENTPSPPLSPKALIFTRDELHDTLLFPGRYYIILEEEFDILPLIAAYASISRKTLCCMPFVEASQSWRVLLSAISPSHEVIEVAAQSSPFSPGVAQYMSSDRPSLLIQSFATWQTHQTVTSISDAFLAWGFLNLEDKQLTRIRDTILSAQHTCAIVTQQEFENSKLKAYFASFGLIEHPNSSLIKQFETASLLTSSRAITQLILNDPDFYHNVHLLYKAALDFYTVTPIGEVRWSKTRTAELANIFAAKILLHGREEEGSARFKPNGAMLPVDQKTIQKLGLSLPAQLGLIAEEDESSEDDDDSDNAPGAFEMDRVPSPGPATNMTYHANHPKHTYIIPEEDFDILPLIAYFASTYPMTVCYISHCENATYFQAVLGKVISRKISRPGKNSKNTEDQISKFLRSGPGLLLLRGSVPPPMRLTNARIDAVVCYGVSSPERCNQHTNKSTQGDAHLPDTFKSREGTTDEAIPVKK
ncbi:unnamed protein product [Rhizoctonia solani]|uniref:Uncharacterized protein n=1 Tax=Rhizoctonia solani TaxID=456999 RepID=A0A8H2ZW54_9AGAM|nr:unnamed protein product [Rhizoctonia solani]